MTYPDLNLRCEESVPALRPHQDRSPGAQGGLPHQDLPEMLEPWARKIERSKYLFVSKSLERG